jgi:TIR domain
MAETSAPHEAGRPRIFISYSTADRQRVSGLASLLEALGHGVFIDYRPILPGRR